MVAPWITLGGVCVDCRLSISKAYSAYLDLFRIGAALIVVSAHAVTPVISGNRYLFPFGEDAVQAFFVLSGFVIASVVDGREGNFLSFAVARLSRLWSVLIPAIFIAPAMIHLGLRLWPQGYLGHFQGVILSSEFAGLIASAFFINEIWGLSLTPKINVPLWSIGFEFWYYTIFAVFVFAPRRFRWPGVALAAAIAGPQILLLMPGWILGAALYRFRARVRMSRPTAIAVFIAGPIFVLAGHALHIAPLLQGLYLPLLGPGLVYGLIFFARDFLWQNLVGLALAAHLAAGYILFGGVDSVPDRLAKAVRWAAGLTYTIYLLHFPAELVLSGALSAVHDGAGKTILIIAGATVISGAFGIALEPLKNPLRKWMVRAIGPSARVRATLPAA